MKNIEVREFQEKVIDYLTGNQVLTIECDGKPLGYYLPAEVSSEPIRLERAWDELGETVQRILDETGMTEDELVRLMDPNVPERELPRPRRILAAHAPRG